MVLIGYIVLNSTHLVYSRSRGVVSSIQSPKVWHGVASFTTELSSVNANIILSLNRYFYVRQYIVFSVD